MNFFKTLVFAVIHFFTGVFDKTLGTDAAKAFEAGILAFIKTDVGQLALDAVNYASTLVGQSSDALRAAAVTKFKADLTKAGHDLGAIGNGLINLYIEAAFTVVNKTVAAIPSTVK